MPTPTIKDKGADVAGSLTGDLLEVQASVVAPPENITDEDAIAMAREALRELAALKQQLAAMGISPATAAAGATLPPGLTPAAVGASVQLEAKVQERDEERLRAAWALEHQLPLQIEPDDIDRQVMARRYAKWEQTGRQGAQPWFPPRRFQINGVVIWLDVGRVIQVPASIFNMVENTRTKALLDLIPAGENRVGFWVGDNPFGT